MSQHPMTIANQAGASFRSDLNAQTLAIVSQSSGAAAPSTTYAYMWWADTTTGLLKQRNGANSGWIIYGLLADLGIQSGSQVVGTVGGTVDAITLAFTPALVAFDPGPKWWRATGANTVTTPTVKRDGLALKTLVKGNNLALSVGDISGAGAWMCSQYDVGTDREVLLNPATGISSSATAASTAEVKAGTVSTKYIAPDKLLAAQGFTATHLSSAITLAAAGGASYAHGLTREPTFFQVTLTCITADVNFAVGTRLVVPSNYGSGISFHGMTIRFDATNVFYRFVNVASIYIVNDPTTGNQHNIANANWQAYIRVWA